MHILSTERGGGGGREGEREREREGERERERERDVQKREERKIPGKWQETITEHFTFIPLMQWAEPSEPATCNSPSAARASTRASDSGQPRDSSTPSPLPDTRHGTALKVGVASLLPCLPLCLCACLYFLYACALLHDHKYGMKHFNPCRSQHRWWYLSVRYYKQHLHLQKSKVRMLCVCIAQAVSKVVHTLWWNSNPCLPSPHVFRILYLSPKWCSSFHYCTNTDNCAFHHPNIPPSPNHRPFPD